MKLHTLFLLLLLSFTAVFSQEKEQVICGDILEIYSKKPKYIDFLTCKPIVNSQKVVEAKYSCKGKDIYKVIRFFNKKTAGHLKPLGYYCCGWETLGGSGIEANKKLTLINKDYGIFISISSGETLNSENPKKENFIISVVIVLV